MDDVKYLVVYVTWVEWESDFKRYITLEDTLEEAREKLFVYAESKNFSSTIRNPPFANKYRLNLTEEDSWSFDGHYLAIEEVPYQKKIGK